MKKIALFSTALTAVALTFSAFIVPSKNNLLVVSAPVKKSAAAETWVLDNTHSAVKFSVTHLVVSEVEGNFKLYNGSLSTAKSDFSDAKINFTVDVSSVNTDNENRDKHLKSDDFFNAEKFPQMKFESTSFQPLGGNKYALKGNLTIRDITKPVTFDVTFGGTVKDPWGNTKAGFKAKTTINRFDYNLKWNAATEAGGLVVSKEVEVTVNAELKKS
jgi:polyisoprenoid-binding protein YceI